MRKVVGIHQNNDQRKRGHLRKVERGRNEQESMETKAMFFFRLLLVVLLTVVVVSSPPLSLLAESTGENRDLQGRMLERRIEGECGCGQSLKPEIDLPQWSGTVESGWTPECYYEVNSGIYLGRSKDEGFLISYNNGATWEQKNKGLSKKLVYPFKTPKVRELTGLGVDPVNNQRLAVTTVNGLYLSMDLGDTWRKVKTIPQVGYLTSVALSPHDPETIAIGTAYSGIYESKDGGVSWAKLTGGLYFLMQSRYTEEISALAYHPEEENTLLFACGFGKGLYSLDRVKGTATKLTLFTDEQSVKETAETAEHKSGTGGETVKGLHFRLNSSPPGYWLKDDWVLEAVTSERKLCYSWTFHNLIREEPLETKKNRVLAEEAWKRRLRSAGKYGLYVNYAWKKFEDHLPFIKKHNLNSIVVDFKDDLGYLTYNTKLSFPQKIGAVQEKFRLEELVKKAHEHGIYIIGRVVVFKDSRLFKYNNHQFALWDKVAQKPWAEKEYWVDPYAREVWEYNIAIAAELEEMGVDEVQFDYIRFPTDGRVSRITYRHQRKGMSRIDALESFLAMARERISVPISTDLYGFNCWYRMEGMTGQNVDVFSEYVDVIAPMFYPSHFPQSFYGEKAYTERARILYEEGVARAASITEGRALIRPYVQAFLLGGELKMKTSQYTEYLLKQIEGTQAAPSSGFTLWNNSNRYYMVKTPLGPYISDVEQDSSFE